VHKDEAWSDSAADLYAQAVAAQWNPDEAIDWSQPVDLPAPVEQAIVQVMTYMIENENAALLVPARFLGSCIRTSARCRPRWPCRSATKPATSRCSPAASATAARRRPCPPPVGRPPSSLLDEPDFSVASFLLSVLGEGTFVNLLQFLQTQAPDR
jgi:hypothetical protein